MYIDFDNRILYKINTLKVLLACNGEEKKDVLIEDTAKAVVGDDLVSKDKAGEAEGQAGQQDQMEHIQTRLALLYYCPYLYMNMILILILSLFVW